MIKQLILTAILLVNGCTTRLDPAHSTPVDSSEVPADLTRWATTQAVGAVALSARNTTITFIGSALMNSHEGGFARLAGWIDCPAGDVRNLRLSVAIDMGSVYSKIDLLTQHLKAHDFFDVTEFPVATFVSTRIEPSSITGNLTLHGVTQPVSFPATCNITANDVTIDGHLTIRQSDFAMQSARTTTDEVPVTVKVHVHR